MFNGRLLLDLIQLETITYISVIDSTILILFSNFSSNKFTFEILTFFFRFTKFPFENCSALFLVRRQTTFQSQLQFSDKTMRHRKIEISLCRFQKLHFRKLIRLFWLFYLTVVFPHFNLKSFSFVQFLFNQMLHFSHFIQVFGKTTYQFASLMCIKTNTNTKKSSRNTAAKHIFTCVFSLFFTVFYRFECNACIFINEMKMWNMKMVVVDRCCAYASVWKSVCCRQIRINFVYSTFHMCFVFLSLSLTLVFASFISIFFFFFRVD